MVSARFLFALSTTIAVAAAAAAIPQARLAAATQGGPKMSEVTPAGAVDQVDLAVTVYNSSLALVRDVRQFAIPKGEGELHFVDVAATVNPATVHLRSLSDPSRLTVLEQNYEYDLLDPDKLLRKYVGRDVTLIRRRTENGTSVDEPVTATLVSYNAAPIWKIGREYVTGIRTDHIRFPELPSNLFVRPTLVWKLDNRGDARHQVETSYLAGGISWSADYVLTVSRDDARGDLDGWVTLTNKSGTAFRDATVQFVAGSINRVEPAVMKRGLQVFASRAYDAAPMEQEAFSEYHLYSLGRRTTIANNETKQLSMLSGTGVPVQKRYVVNGDATYYHNAQAPGEALDDEVETFYRFSNDERSGLGMPLPAGVVRVYQHDSKGGTHFVGEDRIDHTPKDETLDLKIGNAFDIVCERKQTDFEKAAANVFEVEYEVTLRNHKDVPVTVEVNEPIGGSWKMLSSSYDWKKTGAWAASFAVPVPVDGTSVLKYRVRVTY